MLPTTRRSKSVSFCVRFLDAGIGRATSRVVDGASDSDAAESTSDDDDDDDGDDGDDGDGDGDDDKDDAGVDGEDDDDEKEDAAPKSRRSAAAAVENATGSTEDYFLVFSASLLEGFLQ